MEQYNPAMITDFYEFTMSNGYALSGIGDTMVYFDMYFRQVPDGSGFAIAAGLGSLIDFIKTMRFTKSDIDYLRAKNLFDEAWLGELSDFRFRGDIFAVPEGSVVFPNEPLVVVRAPASQAQLIETYLLLCLNHQSLIATKSNRIVRAADGRAVLEFGARRAQGEEAAVMGARAAYIAGCIGSSCTVAEQRFGVPAEGTMAHSWVQVFDDEYTAFYNYCKLYPNSASLLVDTYNVLKSGVPNAIKVFKELGITKCSVRIDSGDITYLSKKVRAMLDAAGLTDCKIVASNSLDEVIIRDILFNKGCVDIFGVGERLITAKSDPVFGGIYKLVAVEDENGAIIPKIKVSENVSKITTPHFKKLYRLYENATGKAIADYICVHDESLDGVTELTLFDPEYTWKKQTVNDFTAREMLVPVFLDGKLVYEQPSIEEIRAYCAREVDSLWDEVKRFENPHNYYVDLSDKLWGIRNELLEHSR